MNDGLLIAGGGIGGLACALAMSRAGRAVTVLEQAGDFTEVGAGIQLGPNAMRVLADWGCDRAVKAVATYPDDLRVRDAHDGRELGHLRLGSTALARYGHPYACIHRADLHRLLLEAVQLQTPATLHLRARVEAFDVQADVVRVALDEGRSLCGAALIGCDGIWSRVRERLLDVTPARLTGHLAYRGLIPAERLAHGLRSNSVQVWLGAGMHVVSYPVRSGEWINVVAVVHGRLGEGHGGDDPQRWSQDARVGDLLAASGPLARDLHALIDACPGWTLWALHDRPDLRGPSELACGPVALLGDAAHPMRPYFSQGAGMALEDAWTLGLLADRCQASTDWAALFARYAVHRWARNARVQRGSRNNGRAYHARGPLRWGRNMAMKLLGERLLANHWLYSGPARPPVPP